MVVVLLILLSVGRVLLLILIDDLVALFYLVLDSVKGLRGHERKATLQFLKMAVLLCLTESNQLASILLIVLVRFRPDRFVSGTCERGELD